MLDQMSNGTVTILIFVVLVMIVTTGLLYGVIFVTYSPEAPLDLGIIAPEAQPVALPPTLTPAPLLAPTYPPTWTPIPTPTPLPTGTATQTRTPTPTATATNTPTPLPTYTSTATDTPTVTNTPPPTATATQIPYFVEDTDDENNCYDIGMKGTVVDVNGIPIEGVDIRYGEWNIGEMHARTDVDGSFALPLVVDNRTNAKRSHVWYIQLMENGQPASEVFKWQSDTVKDCDEDNSVQVKVIDFRRRY